MSDESKQPPKLNKAMVVFSIIGLFVAVSVFNSLITDLVDPQDRCEIPFRSVLPSPDGKRTLAIEYRSCSIAGASTELLLKDINRPETTYVVASIEQPSSDSWQKPYPLPVTARWINYEKIEIYVAKHSIPDRVAGNIAGVIINYVAF